MACNECYGSGSISDWYQYGSYTCIEGGDSNNPNDPCNSTIDPIVVYISGSGNANETKGEVYSSIKNSTKYTGTFFPFISSSVQTAGGGYWEVTNGNVSDPYNNICPPTDLTWDKLNEPFDISIYGTKVLASYPDIHAVLLFDTSDGTKPTGSIVAGIFGVGARNVSESILQPGETNRIGTVALNTPTTIVWRDDGERFAVYSSGNAKSMTIWSSSGEWLQTIGVNKDNHNSPDNQFGYQGFTGSYATEPSTPLSESYDADINDIRYLPQLDTGFTYELTPEPVAKRPNNYNYQKAAPLITKMEYQLIKAGVGGTYDPDYDILYVGQLAREENKREVNIVDFHYKINAFVPYYNKKFQILAFYESVIASDPQFANGAGDIRKAGDVISDFTITKKQHLPGTNNSGVRQEIVIITPNSYYTGSGLSGFDSYTYYDVRELTLLANFENNTLSTTKLRSNTEGSRIGPYPIYDTSGNYLFRKHVRASVGYVNGNIYTFIAQGASGFVQNYYTSLQVFGAAVAATALNSYVVTEWGINQLAKIIGKARITTNAQYGGAGSTAWLRSTAVGWWFLVAVVIVALIFWQISAARKRRVLKAMDKYDEATSRIGVTFGSGTTDTSYSWNQGVTNHILFDWGQTLTNPTYVNQASGSTDNYLYSLGSDGGLYKGAWNNANSKVEVFASSSLLI